MWNAEAPTKRYSFERTGGEEVVDAGCLVVFIESPFENKYSTQILLPALTANGTWWESLVWELLATGDAPQ